jgi:adenine-specific DNA-methyltransferase
VKIASKFDQRYQCVLALSDCNEFIKTLPAESVDLTVSSPPYFMGKAYDKSTKIEDFIEAHKSLLPELLRVTKPGGSLCWQVGYHIKDGVTTPLDFLVHGIFSSSGALQLRNRIIWTFGHGLHTQRRFSGRHETILWYTKGDGYYFDLDRVRVPQKYPGKVAYVGKRKGQPSGNPLGKNPADVWDIPNVKALHVEKTEHPCQFPVALAQRLVRGLSPANGRVFDPFMGAGSSGIAALLEKRKFVGVEINKAYYDIAHSRCELAFNEKIKIRPLEKPIQVAGPNSSVVKKPSNFV